MQPGWSVLNSQLNLRLSFFLKWSSGSILSMLSLLIAGWIVYNACFCSPVLSCLLSRTACILQCLCSTHCFPTCLLGVCAMDACSHWCPPSPSCVLQTQLCCCEPLPRCKMLFLHLWKVWALTCKLVAAWVTRLTVVLFVLKSGMLPLTSLKLGATFPCRMEETFSCIFWLSLQQPILMLWQIH